MESTINPIDTSVWSVLQECGILTWGFVHPETANSLSELYLLLIANKVELTEVRLLEDQLSTISSKTFFGEMKLERMYISIIEINN